MPMRLHQPLPDLDGVTEWVNGAADIERLRGRPVLVHFWSISCCLCRDGFPALNGWRDKYGERHQLHIVGIHTPRAPGDRSLEAVREAIIQHGLQHSIGIDNSYAVTDSFRNEYVPAFYLFDAAGQLRFYGAGEKAVGMVEQRLPIIVGTKK